MNIAILTSGILPVPAVQGGAVENLIDFCLDYNNQHQIHHITVYSINHPLIKNIRTLDTNVNHYQYIDTNSWMAKIKKKIYTIKNGENGYYHYNIEYYFDRAVHDIQKKKFDIILVENRPGYALGLRKRTNAKLVLHQENDFLNSQTLHGRSIYDAYSRIINTSSYITNRVKTINPSDTKCKTVLNGIDTQLFSQAEPLSRKQVELSDNDFVIAYSGRLNEEKGILPLIQATKQLSSRPNLKLLIIGASSYGKDKRPTPFIEQLEKESEPIKDRVIFTGFIDYNQVPSYLKMADIAVVPSMWEEPFGLTVVEAMAAGLPLITTKSGGIPEICEGVATIVDRENIVDNLASAIHDLYNNPVKRKQMATTSLERSKLFDKETYAKNIFEALEGI
jgi:glycosyltransferase involved in cell wall biosynthesis